MPRLGVRYHGLTTLTVRAEVRRAATLHNATNSVAAPRARQPFPIVHLESADTVVAIAPARPLRLVEHRPNGLEQTNATRARQRGRHRLRVDARDPECFSRVDVPDPRQHTLIQQRHLNGGSTP